METLFIGNNIHFLSETDSTNTYAMNLLRNVNVIDGTAIYTDNQTQGRGQRGSVWHSEIGENVIVSVILKPTFISVNEAFYLSKICALAIYDVLADYIDCSQFDIKIKWPNDILVNKKKIAGVLIENTYHHQHLHYSVLGIGLNVNQVIFNELSEIATSIKLSSEYGLMIDKKLVMQSLFSYLEKWYFKLKEKKFEEIDATYLKQLFGLHEELIFLNTDSITIKAIITGIAQDGKLMLKLENGDIKHFDVKEIKQLF